MVPIFMVSKVVLMWLYFVYIYTSYSYFFHYKNWSLKVRIQILWRIIGQKWFKWNWFSNVCEKKLPLQLYEYFNKLLISFSYYKISSYRFCLAYFESFRLDLKHLSIKFFWDFLVVLERSIPKVFAYTSDILVQKIEENFTEQGDLTTRFTGGATS